jgi:voltage-gated sodium channel
MYAWCRRVADLPAFHHAAMAVIVVNAVVLGLETSKALYEPNLGVFKALHWVFQALFTAELLIRFGAAGSAGRFVRDGWNVFDTLVVAAGYVPAAGPTATVARLARVLRIARLIEVSEEMKLIVATIVRSVRSLGQLVLMILILLYTFAIIGYHLFEEHDEKNWGTLGQAMWTLFQTMTLEGWVDKQKDTFAVVPHQTWIFYSVFLLFATYFVLNLFVAIVVNNLQELKEERKEETAAAHPQADLLGQIAAMRKQLELFEERVRKGA